MYHVYSFYVGTPSNRRVRGTHKSKKTAQAQLDAIRARENSTHVDYGITRNVLTKVIKYWV
jgi:hypothetical protein